MKTFVPIFLLTLIALPITWSQVRNDDFFPLNIGNQWTYEYKTSDWDQLADVMYSDSGTAICSIISKDGTNDSTIWNFRETRDIVHRIDGLFSPHFDTSYSIIDTILFDIVEHTQGYHLLVTAGSLNWESVFPLTQEFADSATFFRYSSASVDTFTLTAQYPKSVSKPYYILLISFKRLIGPTNISLSAPYITGVVSHSNHILKSAIVTSTQQERNTVAPQRFEMSQNFPNPFNPVTVIPFSVATKSVASLRIYDILGRHITTIFNGAIESGKHNAIWNARDQASGTYIAILESNGFSQTIKLVLLK